MKILVAVDGSKYSLRAAKYALELTLRLKESCEISLISVHDDTGVRHASRFVGKKAVREYLDDLSAVDLKPALAAAAKAGIGCQSIVKIGNVAQVITETADNGKFDLIIMGSKGRTALKDLLMGSVAQRVGALSPVPVLLVK
jgi:nucleotide-binding universal stress UspA family protein